MEEVPQAKGNPTWHERGTPKEVGFIIKEQGFAYAVCLFLGSVSTARSLQGPEI